MKLQLLGLGLGFIISFMPPALAVQPTLVDANEDVAWSKVIDNPFDGRIVYDRNYKDGFVFVSSWSKHEIRAIYTQARSALVGYHYYRRHWYGYYPYAAPVYQQYLVESVPDSIKFAINGRFYTYRDGPVQPEIAVALANAPPRNMLIRLVWQDGSTKDMEIGKDTVKAWKAVF